MLPSYKYKYLLDILANSNGINIDYNGIDRVVSDLCIHSSTARLKAGKIDSMQYGNANYDNDYFNKFTAVQDVAISGAYAQQLIETRYIHAWKANHKVLLSKIPSNCSLIVKKKDEKLYQFITNSSVNGHYLPGPGTIPTDTKTYWQQSLPPTAPLSYQLEQGDYFTIINRSGRWGKSSSGKYYLFFSSGNQPFQSSSFTSVNLGARYEKDIELEYGDKWYLDSNLPAVTFIDLVKFIAAWSFRFLTWNESTKTLKFEEYSFDKTSAINLDTITIEEQELKRSIEGFANKNNIKCKDDTYIRSIYIDNNTLEDEKTISEIKMQALTPKGKEATLYEYYKDGETYKKESTDFAIGDLSTSPTQTQLFIMKGLYDYIGVSDDFVNLFDFSTSIKLKVRFPLYKFLRMKEKQTYLYHGTYYICTSAKWSDGLSELTLVKI